MVAESRNSVTSWQRRHCGLNSPCAAWFPFYLLWLTGVSFFTWIHMHHLHRYSQTEKVFQNKYLRWALRWSWFSVLVVSMPLTTTREQSLFGLNQLTDYAYLSSFLYTHSALCQQNSSTTTTSEMLIGCAHIPEAMNLISLIDILYSNKELSWVIIPKLL